MIAGENVRIDPKRAISGVGAIRSLGHLLKRPAGVPG